MVHLRPMVAKKLFERSRDICHSQIFIKTLVVGLLILKDISQSRKLPPTTSKPKHLSLTKVVVRDRIHLILLWILGSGYNYALETFSRLVADNFWAALSRHKYAEKEASEKQSLIAQLKLCCITMYYNELMSMVIRSRLYSSRFSLTLYMLHRASCVWFL